MGYPTNVQAFATKNQGDTIQNSHVNDLQTETAAIETGLLNGLQHALVISTGGLTVSTGGVQINGPSTFAGAVTLSSGVASTVSFASSVTFSGNAQVNGTLLVGGNPVGSALPGAKVAITSSVTTANSTTWTGISWNVEINDAAGLHSTAANSSRINLTSSGTWLVGAQLLWDDGAGSTAVLAARIMANDTNVIAAHRYYANNGAATQVSQMVSGVYYTGSTTDYIICAAQRVGAGTLGLSSGTSTNDYGYTHFWAQRVG